MTAPKKPTAVQKLERSQQPRAAIQHELMGDDVDLEHLVVYLKSKIKFDTIDRVQDIVVTRTVEGASTVRITLIDNDRAVLRSGLLNSRLDIQLDNLWFRLIKVEKQSDNLVLTFEDREIAILRTYKKNKIAHRSQVTRAEFVNNLIREVKEFSIPVVIPELHKVQPIQKATDLPYEVQQIADKSGGIPTSAATPNAAQDAHRHGEQSPATALRRSLTVKHAQIDKEQIKNANTILSVGSSMGCDRKLLVISIMTAIQESVLRNLGYGDAAGPDSRGLFQQRASWGSLRDRLDPATASRMFFNRAIPVYNSDPTLSHSLIANAVQHSAHPNAYAEWREEAEKIVNAYGVVGGDTEGLAGEANLSGQSYSDGSGYIFYRGIPKQGGKSWKHEDSWTCIRRLADEVAVRAFFVSGVFYWIFEDDLFKSKPIVTITEFSEGVLGIDGDYDTGKTASSCELTATVGTWLVPPGAIIVLQNMGPWNGRWLVNTFERSLFDSTATITLEKPQPRLPEPIQNDINETPTWADSATPAATDTYAQTGAYINPLPTKMTPSSEFSIPDAEGAPNKALVKFHAAKDWFAPGGTIVVAPIAGTIVEVKQSVGSSGQIFGGVVKLQQDNGYVWVFRHVQPGGALANGARVQQGDPIATVVTWADKPSASHAHIEIWRTLAGGYHYENMIDPVKFIKGQAS